MTKKKKPVADLTTEEMAKKLFPKKVVEKAKEVAHEKDKKQGQPDTDYRYASRTERGDLRWQNAAYFPVTAPEFSNYTTHLQHSLATFTSV